jgi:glycosyltransferase involved in cell wall biosynthesis
MIRIFLNGLAASAGAGLTYLYNVVPHLSALPAVRTTLAVQPNLRQNFAQFSNVDVLCPPGVSDAGRRFIFEQWKLPDVIRRSHADVLISAGNFALRKSPVPQILLSGNSLYKSGDFCRDLRSRGEYAMLLDNSVKGALAKKSVQWADQTIAPSEAFADELRRWTGREVNAIYHGFDHKAFFGGGPLSEDVQKKLDETKDCLRLLFVSHYNYYRNFETLLRALPLIQKLVPERNVKLFLTCTLEAGANPGSYDGSQAGKMVRDLGISDSVVELGAVPYGSLHHLYRACDLYVTPAYTETFAHPLVEAMASGLPVVASDLAVHQEVCGDAALYFPRFSAECLAESVASVLGSEMRSKLTLAGKDRLAHFSWFKHVGSLLQIARELCENGQASNALFSGPPSVNASPVTPEAHLSSNAASPAREKQSRHGGDSLTAFR